MDRADAIDAPFCRDATSSAAAAPRHEAWALAGDGFWTFLDQALVSGTNFLGGIALARLCTPREYGAFAVAFITLMLLVGIQRALATDPLAVLGAGRSPSELRTYVTSVWHGQSWGAALAVALTLGASCLALVLIDDKATARALAGCAVAAYFFLGHDFRRRLLFIRLDPRAVFRLDAIFCIVYLSGVAALWLSTALSALSVMLVMALSAGASCLYGSRLTREMRGARGAPGLWRRNLSFGRWALGDFLGGALMIQGAVYVAAASGGNESAAALESSRLILAPLQILIIGGSGFLIPWTAQRLAAGGPRGLLGAMRPVAAVWGLVFVAYPSFVALTPGFWLELFYAGRYRDAELTLVFWAGVFALSGLAQLPWIVIQALRRPDLSMTLSLTVGVVSLLLMVWLTPALSVNGVVAGRFFGQILSLIALVWIAASLLRRVALAEKGRGS